MTVCALSYKLLILWQAKLVWWNIIIVKMSCEKIGLLWKGSEFQGLFIWVILIYIYVINCWSFCSQTSYIVIPYHEPDFRLNRRSRSPWGLILMSQATETWFFQPYLLSWISDLFGTKLSFMTHHPHHLLLCEKTGLLCSRSQSLNAGAICSVPMATLHPS